MLLFNFDWNETHFFNSTALPAWSPTVTETACTQTPEIIDYNQMVIDFLSVFFSLRLLGRMENGNSDITTNK